MKRQPGYEQTIVMAFIEAHGERREDGQLAFLNEIRLTESARDTLRRWEDKDVVPLESVDAWLLKHDVMLFELDQWATEEYGRDGFVDPYAEPAELAG